MQHPCLAGAILAVALLAPSPIIAADAQLERGKYLVALGGCNDCHTPGYFFGKPDLARFLGGSMSGLPSPAGSLSAGT